MVHLFDSLVRTIPDGVALTNIKQDGDILTLEGRSQSNARVSAYMRNLEGSGWMTNPDLSIIEAKSQDKAAGQPAASSMDTKTLPYVFTLKVKLANPNEADKNGTAPVDGQAPGATPAATPAGAAPAPAATPATTPAPAAPAAPAPAQAAPAQSTRPQEGAAS